MEQVLTANSIRSFASGVSFKATESERAAQMRTRNILAKSLINFTCAKQLFFTR